MKNKCVLVTGASSDIGIALVRRLLSASEEVCIVAHFNATREPLQQVQEEFPDRISLVQADFSNPESVKGMIAHLKAEDAMVNSVVHLPASRLQLERFGKLKLASLQKDFAVQVESILSILQYLLPKMAAMDRAKVVFVLSSVVHGMPPKFMSMYTIVKYAQLGLMRSLAADYAGTSVCVNAVSPSMVETRFLADVASVAVRMNAANSPLGRNAGTEDVIGVIEFLLSSASDYMTGIDIPVTAGSVC